MHLLQDTYRRLNEMSQAIVCHHFHSVLQRVCLLMAAERLQSDTLDVTREVIAHALSMAIFDSSEQPSLSTNAKNS
jgi:hypothetical protein